MDKLGQLLPKFCYCRTVCYAGTCRYNYVILQPDKLTVLHLFLFLFFGDISVTGHPIHFTFRSGGVFRDRHIVCFYFQMN